MPDAYFQKMLLKDRELLTQIKLKKINKTSLIQATDSFQLARK